MSEQGRRTHLYEFHSKSGKIDSFAGFNMPIWYKGITTEHLAVRNTVGLFDVTHMGRVLIKGSEAEAFLNFVTTNDVSKLQPLDAHYSIMCNENGGIKDDFVLSRQENDRFFMVYNAANRTKNFRWLSKQAIRFKVKIEDVSENVAMFAVQGPKAQDTLQKITSEDVSSVTRFKCSWTELAGHQAFISRTGYTGEDGFEVFIWGTPPSNPKRAIDSWKAIIKSGEEYKIEPCGLGSRDTLRLEAGMCLYGSDIDENTTPLEARISFVVKLHKGDFIGKQALLNKKTRGIEKKRVGLRVPPKAGIPRPRHEVFKDSEKIGYVTSGTLSPLLKQGIAMAYVKTEHAILGEIVNIKIRDRKVEAKIVKFPFYDPQSYGHTRKN